jgi:hypothetical protein
MVMVENPHSHSVDYSLRKPFSLQQVCSKSKNNDENGPSHAIMERLCPGLESERRTLSAPHRNSLENNALGVTYKMRIFPDCVPRPRKVIVEG